MTTSMWTRSEIEKQFSGCSTLKELIGLIENDFSTRGEVVCEIRVNGILISEEDEQRFSAQPTQEIHDLSVRSARPEKLVIDALASARAFIPILENRALATADLLRSVDLPRAQASFNEITQGCQWLIETLLHARGAAQGLELDREIEGFRQTEKWTQSETFLIGVLREITSAHIAKDWVLLADLMEYELTSALQSWNTAIGGS